MAEEDANGAGDGTPKIFRSLTGVIGGATAVIVALGGLYTAYEKYFAKQDTEEAEPAPDTATGTNDVQADAPTPAPAQPKRYSYTTGDGGTLEYVSGMWVWTDGQGNSWRYSEESNNGAVIYAKMLQDGKYIWLQWPVPGGEALQSFDDQENWNNPIKVTPEENAS